MKFLKPLIITSFLILICAGASAEQSVATVDIPKILELTIKNSAEGRALEKRRDSEKNRLLDKKTEIEKMEQKLRSSQASADSAEAESFRQKVRDYQRELSDIDESLGKELAKLQKSAFERINKAVQEIASARGITLVLSKSEVTPSVVLYSNNTADLTDEVLKKLE